MTNLGCDQDDVDCLISKDMKAIFNAYEIITPGDDPSCRDACQISPAVDGKVVIDMIGAMSYTSRKVPTIHGWCKHDGATFVNDVFATEDDDNFTPAEYK